MQNVFLGPSVEFYRLFFLILYLQKLDRTLKSNLSLIYLCLILMVTKGGFIHLEDYVKI